MAERAVSRYGAVRAALNDLVVELGNAEAVFLEEGAGSEGEAQRLDHVADTAIAVALLAQTLAYNNPADRRIAELTVLDALLDLVAPEMPVGKVDGWLIAAATLVERALDELTVPEPADG